MNPVNALSKALAVDPKTGAFLYGGLGLLAVIAIASSFGIDLRTSFIMGAYFIGLTLFLLIVVHIISDPIIKRVLGWFLTCLIIVVVSLLVFTSVFPNQRYFSPSYCLVRFWEKCSAVEEIIADRTPSIVSATQQATPSPPPRDVKPANYQVFVQFAGIIKRDDIKVMMRRLRDLGWNMQGTEGGGQRTSNAAGLNVVRYGPTEDAEAATALAAAVQAIGPSNATIATEKNPDVKSKSLEIWISR
jgi:hypothetical protein